MPIKTSSAIENELPPAWEVIAKIHSQDLCAAECEWQQTKHDPYNTGDHDFVVGECTVPTPRQCPAFESYCKENT